MKTDMNNFIEKLSENGIVKLDKISNDDLSWFRSVVNLNYYNRISSCYPELIDILHTNNITNYHYIRDLVDHEILWKKKYRLFTKSQINEMTTKEFYDNLSKIFGEFRIADQTYDGELFEGQEEVYWRLVSPGIESDVGDIHADGWFHELHKLNTFSDNNIYETLKVWIPIYCEINKNGLIGAVGSHNYIHKYYTEKRNNINYPVFDKSERNFDFELIPTQPGEILVFGENFLHGGALNNGSETRVSIEITLKFGNQN